MVLWKKESAQHDACYIDLLSSDGLGAIFNASLNLLAVVTQKNDKSASAYRKGGNEKFRANDWRSAMQSYNDCLRFAPNGSENISLAYANRSACFLHMQFYDECLADIELAKAANYPKGLMKKLDDRKAKCLKLMNEKTQQRNKTSEVVLSFAPNEQFPCLANVLDIRSNDEFGNHIVATRDVIDVGQIILVEDAFVHGILRTDQALCKTCLKIKKNLIPCPNCAEHMFCSVDCMNSNRIHGMMCGTSFNRKCEFALFVELILLAATAFPNVESLMAFVESALSTRDFDTPECDTDAQAKYRMFLKLSALTEELDEAVKTKITPIFRMSMEIPEIKQRFHSKQAKRFLMHLIWQHFCIVQTNSMSFGSAGKDSLESRVVIWMMANFLSLFNHSCYPNALHLRHGNQVFVYTCRPVKKGEQLFINYKTMANQMEFQQTGLRENLRFQCKCSKCIPRFNKNDCQRLQLQPDFYFLLRSDENDLKEPQKRSVLKKKASKLLKNYGRWPWSNEIDFITNCFAHYMATEYTDYIEL